MYSCGQTNSGCIIEGGLLTQVQTHAMETLRPINLAGCIIEGGLLTQVANTGPNTAMETLRPINLAVL